MKKNECKKLDEILKNRKYLEFVKRRKNQSIDKVFTHGESSFKFMFASCEIIIVYLQWKKL